MKNFLNNYGLAIITILLFITGGLMIYYMENKIYGAIVTSIGVGFIGIYSLVYYVINKIIK